MVEEVLEPFAEQLWKYRELGMILEMKVFGLGLAKGIIKFTREGKTEFKQWAQDDALEWLSGFLMDLKKKCIDKREQEYIHEIYRLIEG